MKRKLGPVLDYFDEAKIALGRELHHHPEILQKIMDAEAQDSYPELLGVIAAHFNIIMDGLYSQDDLNKLAHKLVFKLRATRTGLITPAIGIPAENYGKEVITHAEDKPKLN